MKGSAQLLLVVLAFGILQACSDQPGTYTPARVNIPFTPDISINEVMVAQIDHAAHFIWDAADPDRELSMSEWQEVEHHSIQLISSRAAMTMGGTGVNDAMWIAQVSWRDYVNQMNDAAVLALTSARLNDKIALTVASDDLIESCEGCHQQYKPSIPTEGYTHNH
ncbi:MAG: hypothetical protein GKR91_13100 [Pseudomonadales bacterium]|nr:hypothetical protein [Pseudomonadales bacterium]